MGLEPSDAPSTVCYTSAVLTRTTRAAALAGLALLLTGCGADETPDTVSPDAAPTSSPVPDDAGSDADSATATADGPSQTRVESFVMPSGNVACVVTAEYAGCQIIDRAYDPPADDVAAGCEPAEADTLLLLADEPASWACTDGSLFGQAAQRDAATLPYGELVHVGRFVCLSVETGVECSEGSGHRFRLAVEDYDLG